MSQLNSPVDINNSMITTAENKLNRTYDATQLLQQTRSHNPRMSALSNTIRDKEDNLRSQFQYSTEMQQLYRRQRKIMWIYVVVFLLLLSCVGYMYAWAFDGRTDIATKDGRAKTEEHIRKSMPDIEMPRFSNHDD